MAEYTVYHNPRCRKSREALALLEENGISPSIVEYLKDIPTVDEFNYLLAKLNLEPQELLRKGELIFKEKYKGKNFSKEEWIDIMLENPKLIERPIVVRDNYAVIGRPIENVIELIKKGR